MFRAAFLSLFSFAACADEESSLLQTASRDSALSKRSQNLIEAENELEDTVEGKGCKGWLVDQAVQHKGDELEEYRKMMRDFGYEDKPNDYVKIGVYCPTFIESGRPEDDFSATPCDDYAEIMKECGKSLKETCKYEQKATKKMIQLAERAIKKEFEEVKKVVNQFPREMRPPLPNINYREIFEPVRVAAGLDENCDKILDGEVAFEDFEHLKSKFGNGFEELTGVRSDQIDALAGVRATTPAPATTTAAPATTTAAPATTTAAPATTTAAPATTTAAPATTTAAPATTTETRTTTTGVPPPVR